MLNKMDAFARKAVLANITPKKAKLTHLEIEKIERPGEDDEYLVEIAIEATTETAYIWIFHCLDLQETGQLGETMDRLISLCKETDRSKEEVKWLDEFGHLEVKKESLKSKNPFEDAFLKMKIRHYGIRNTTRTVTLPKNRFENYSGPISMTVCASYPPGI